MLTDLIPTSAEPRRRIAALDVLRGFALCGILLANVQPIANAGRLVLGPGDDPHASALPGLFVDQRFFEIFSVLFGIGFSLLLRSAATRSNRPRLVLLRRLVALLAVGAAHFALWQGDILTVYAAVGLLVLLPSTWLPRWLVAGLSAAFTVTAVAIGGDRTVLVAGLFLLGSALVRYGVVDREQRTPRTPAVWCAVLTVAAVPVGWLQVTAEPDSRVFALAGLLIAGAYTCALLALLATPLGPALRAVFAPWGRMALTNYLTATLLVLAAAPIVGGAPHTWSFITIMAIAGSILAAQWVWSTLWLRRFRYGPVEWLWRWATWLRRPTLRRQPSRAVTSVVSA